MLRKLFRWILGEPEPQVFHFHFTFENQVAPGTKNLRATCSTAPNTRQQNAVNIEKKTDTGISAQEVAAMVTLGKKDLPETVDKTEKNIVSKTSGSSTDDKLESLRRLKNKE